MVARPMPACPAALSHRPDPVMAMPADDTDRIMAVMAEAFDPIYGEAWNRGQLESALILGSAHYRLIAAGGAEPPPGEQAAGFALVRTLFDEDELLLFAVRPALRGRGLGRALLEQVVGDARARGSRRILLEMRRGNSAERLYRAFGFIQVGLRPDYYRGANNTRCDALTFACSLA
jgi:ribosomal-protein-alanine N-acetyltransferase